jgi:hypothetical protein
MSIMKGMMRMMIIIIIVINKSVGAIAHYEFCPLFYSFLIL